MLDVHHHEEMPQPVDSPIGYFLKRAMLTTRAHVGAKLRPLGLTLPQYICMHMLHRNPGMSNAELAREAFVTRQAMNSVLHELEKMGVVARPATAAAGRVLPATLTDRGEELLAQALPHVWAAEDEVLAALSTTERNELKRLLACIVSPALLPDADTDD
ncbi:transcriptional regulator, MarR family [Segniliparus rotundus DSM 44985]|uniref:Transcriptional regulator, MarR family n=1 Tax=Segniliparus rotundus (strain ATCC BAA-972 / CDC 1076 / CIP 108378 / DSM 44985 / JCM 13578) TaxID=640132 RepID=D6Z7Y6_SEGRD|nr:MarR family transcriptional regulator [Segniliparus rotundus]ADG98066.1 transcriptional regulator, MarR family [Segniliparus rotundus DSM 44985]